MRRNENVIKPQRQLIIRCDDELIRQLKVVAAHDDTSMAEYARSVLTTAIDLRRQAEKTIQQALKASGL